MRKKIFTLVILMLITSALITACAGSAGDNSPANSVNTDPENALDGNALLEQRCTACHTLDRVERASKSAEEWGLTVRRMVGLGAELDAAEQETIIENSQCSKN